MTLHLARRAAGRAPRGGWVWSSRAGQVARLGEQEQADLGDVGAGGDVDEIILGLRVEGIGPGEVEQLAVDLLEIPGVGEVEQAQPDVGFRRDVGDVRRDVTGEAFVEAAVDQLEPVDPAGPPACTGRRSAATCSSATGPSCWNRAWSRRSRGRRWVSCFIPWDKALSLSIGNRRGPPPNPIPAVSKSFAQPKT